MSDDFRDIVNVFQKAGVHVAPSDTWAVQGNKIVKHKALERLAASLRIQFAQPVVIRAEQDEAVVLVTGNLGDRSEWSFGEAHIDRNYRVSGKQAGYLWAMAEKRGKDRVIIKLAGLEAYAESEADEFKTDRSALDDENSRPTEPSRAQPVRNKPDPQSTPAADEIRAKIDKAKSINSVTDTMLMPETQKTLNDLPPAVRDGIRDYAKARLVALGWPGKKAA
jgi:hypothetical protein